MEPIERRSMRIVHNVLGRMFGQPQGLLGRLGGVVMARTNDACGEPPPPATRCTPAVKDRFRNRQQPLSWAAGTGLHAPFRPFVDATRTRV
jgi:hypothetical protein